jgi:hypothetical protein
MNSFDEIITKVVLFTGSIVSATMAIYYILFNDAFCAVLQTVLCIASWYLFKNLKWNDNEA